MNDATRTGSRYLSAWATSDGTLYLGTRERLHAAGIARGMPFPGDTGAPRTRVSVRKVGPGGVKRIQRQPGGEYAVLVLFDREAARVQHAIDQALMAREHEAERTWLQTEYTRRHVVPLTTARGRAEHKALLRSFFLKVATMMWNPTNDPAQGFNFSADVVEQAMRSVRDLVDLYDRAEMMVSPEALASRDARFQRCLGQVLGASLEGLDHE